MVPSVAGPSPLSARQGGIAPQGQGRTSAHRSFMFLNHEHLPAREPGAELRKRCQIQRPGVLAHNYDASMQEGHGFRASLGCIGSSVAGQPELYNDINFYFSIFYLRVNICYVYAATHMRYSWRPKGNIRFLGEQESYSPLSLYPGLHAGNQTLVPCKSRMWSNC